MNASDKSTEKRECLMADHSKHGYRASCNSRHFGDTSPTRIKHSGAGQSNSEVPRSRNLSPRLHKTNLSKLDTPRHKNSRSNIEEQQRDDQQNVAVQASEFHIVSETGFPFFERNHSPKRHCDGKRNVNQRMRGSFPSPTPKKNANVQVGIASHDRTRQHHHGESTLTKGGDSNRNGGATGPKDNQGKQEQQRRTRSPTTVQRCFGSQKQINDSVNPTGDDFPEKLIELQIPEPEKSKKRDESRTTGKDEARKKNKGTTDKLSKRKPTKVDTKKSFLKLRTRGDVESAEESESELVLMDRNYLHMPKKNERENRAHRREDHGSSPRQRSPYSTQQRIPYKLPVSGSGLKQGQGDFPPATSSRDKGDHDHVPASRKTKHGPDDYKFCSPGRKRRLSYSPPKIVIAKSGYRSSSPESLHHSPVRRLNSRSPSPLLRLRTAGVKKPMARACGVHAKATKSLGPPRRKTDQLDTVRSRDRNASPTTTKTASDSELKSDVVREIPEKIAKRVENVEYQKASVSDSDKSEPEEDTMFTYNTSYTEEDNKRGHRRIARRTSFYDDQEVLPPPPPSPTKEYALNRARKKSAAPITPPSKPCVPCLKRRSRSRSRRSVHSSCQPIPCPLHHKRRNKAGSNCMDTDIRALSKEPSRDYDYNAPRPSQNNSLKQIPSPIFFNSLSSRPRSFDDSPDRTYWVSSPRFVPDAHISVPRLPDRSTDRMYEYEVDLNYGSRRPNLTGPQDFERTHTTDLRITQDLRKPLEMSMKAFTNEEFGNGNSKLGQSNSAQTEHEYRPPTILERECELNATRNTCTVIPQELGEDINRRSSQGDRLFPPTPPSNKESVPSQEIKDVVGKSNQDFFAPTKYQDESFEEQQVVHDSGKQLTDNLVKSQSLDESQRVKTSDSLVIDKILRKHSSQKSLKDDDVEAAVKPIVFPSLVTGPAAGQAIEPRTRDISPTKKSSTFSMHSNAFKTPAQNRSYQRKPTPGRSPPPGCAPSFSSGPGSLRDFRLRTISRSPSPRKSVFTALRTREYGNRISFRTRSPPEKNPVTGVNAADCTTMTSGKPAADEKKHETKFPSEPLAPQEPVVRNAKEKQRQVTTSVKEPKSSASMKTKEDDAKPDKKTVKRAIDKADGEGKPAEQSSPPPPKIPRTSIGSSTVGDRNDEAPSSASGRHSISSKTVSISKDAIESESLRSKKRRKSKQREATGKESQDGNLQTKQLNDERKRSQSLSPPKSNEQAPQAGNAPVGENAKTGERDSAVQPKSGEIKSLDQAVAHQVFSKNEKPQQVPKTQTTSTQYEPMETPVSVSDKYPSPAPRSRVENRVGVQMFEKHQYPTSELPPKRPHSIARLPIDESVERIINEERYALYEENRRRSHSESAAKERDRWHDQTFDDGRMRREVPTLDHGQLSSARDRYSPVERMPTQRRPEVVQNDTRQLARLEPNMDAYEDRPTGEKFHGYWIEPRAHRPFSPPVYERSPDMGSDEGIRQRTGKHRPTSPDSSGHRSRSNRHPEQLLEHDQRYRNPKISSRDSSPATTSGPLKNVELREREPTRHKSSTGHIEDNRRISVKFQTPKAYPQRDDEYESREKRYQEYEDQLNKSRRAPSKKKNCARESSSESADSSSMVRTVKPSALSRPDSREKLRASRARDSPKKEIPEEVTISDRPRSPRVSPRRSDKISTEPRKVREDHKMAKMARVDEPYQFSAQIFTGENNKIDLNQQKPRKSKSRKSTEPRESRSSPPTTDKRHWNKEMTVVDKLPSAHSEDLSSLHQDRNRIGDRVDKTRTKNIPSDNHVKQELTAVDKLPLASMDDLSHLHDRHRKEDRAGKTKTKRTSKDNHGKKKGEDDKNSKNDYVLEIEEITSQMTEAVSEESTKNPNSNDETCLWSRDRWEKTVEEIMKRLKEREKSPECHGCGKRGDGKNSCCKTKLSKRTRDSSDHEIIYVVEAPDDKEVQSAAKNKSTNANLKSTSTSVSRRRGSKSPVADEQKGPNLKDQAADVQKSAKDLGPDLQKSAKNKLQPEIAVPVSETTSGKKPEAQPKQSDKKSKISDAVDVNSTFGNSKLSNCPNDKTYGNEPSSAESAGSDSLLNKFMVGDEKSKIEVLGNPRCGPCNTRRRQKIQDSNSLTSNLSNPQKKIIENLFGLEISITPEEGTSRGQAPNQKSDPSKRQTMHEQRKINLSIDQMLQMGLVSPTSQHNLQSDMPPVDKRGSNIFREEEILKERLGEKPSDPKNREQFILENGILLQLKLDKLRRQQKTESIEKLSKLSFEQALLKAEMNRREKIRALAAGRERRDRTASSRRTSPPFPGTSANRDSNVRPNRSIDDVLRAEKMNTSRKAPGVENLQLLRSENQSENTTISGVSELVTTLDSKISRILERIQVKGKRKGLKSKCEKSIRSGPGPTRSKSPRGKNGNDRIQVSRNRDFVKEVLPMKMERLRVKSDNYVLKLRRRDRRIRMKRRTSI